MVTNGTRQSTSCHCSSAARRPAATRSRSSTTGSGGSAAEPAARAAGCPARCPPSRPCCRNGWTSCP